MSDLKVGHKANPSPFKGEHDYELFLTKDGKQVEHVAGTATEIDKVNKDGWHKWIMCWVYDKDEKTYTERWWADGINHLCVDVLPKYSGMFQYIRKQS